MSRSRRRSLARFADPRDEVILAAPDYYVATAFRGRGVYEQRHAATMAEARAAAAAIYAGRPVAIYAVRDGRQLHVENVEPRRRRGMVLR